MTHPRDFQPTVPASEARCGPDSPSDPGAPAASRDRQTLSVVTLSVAALSAVCCVLVLVTLVGTGLARAAEPMDTTVDVVASEYTYDPLEITVPVSDNVTINLTNSGAFQHNIVFELDDGRVEASETLSAGEQDTLEFVAPALAGEYVLYCSIGDHRQLGMEGTLFVEAQSPEPEVVADGLLNPRGLTLDGDRLLIAEGGTGERADMGFAVGNSDGRVTLMDVATGETSTVVDGLNNAVDPGGGVVGANIAVWRGPANASDTVMVALAGGAPEREPRAQILVGMPGQTFAELADVWAAEVALNPVGPEADSNPWRMLEIADGRWLISDAGANAVWAMDANDGSLSVWATIESPVTRPDGSDVPSVPTGLVQAPDSDAVYVSLLGSFTPEAAQVRRLEDLNGDGDAEDDGENELVVGGLTTAVDLAVAPNGDLFVAEFGGGAAVGQLSRVDVESGEVEVVMTGLPALSAIAFEANGDLLAAVGTEGSGFVTSRVIRIPADELGIELPTATPTPETDTPTPETPEPTDTPDGTLPHTIYLPFADNRNPNP